MKSVRILSSLLIAVAALAALKYSLMWLSSIFESFFGTNAVTAAIAIFTVIGALAGIFTIALLKTSTRADLEADLARARDDARNLQNTIDEISQKHTSDIYDKDIEINSLQNQVFDLNGTIKLRNKTIEEQKKDLELKGDTIRSLNREIDRQKDRYAAKDKEYDRLMVIHNSDVKDNARLTDKVYLLLKIINLIKEKFQLTEEQIPELKDYDLVA